MITSTTKPELGTPEAWYHANDEADRAWRCARRDDRPIKPRRPIAPIKPPAATADQVLRALKQAIDKSTDAAKCRAMIGRPVTSGLIITATEGHIAVLEPGIATGKVAPIEPPCSGSVILPPGVCHVVARCRILAQRGEYLRWRWEGQIITIEADDPDGNWAKEWFPVDEESPCDQQETGINAGFIDRLLTARDPVRMDWPKDNIGAITFQIVGADWKYLVMPVRF